MDFNTGTDFKYGVYLKPNGKLVLLEKGEKNKYHLTDGRRSDNALFRLLKIKPSKRPYVGWSGNSMGWGPTKFLNKCEYLGELWEDTK